MDDPLTPEIAALWLHLVSEREDKQILLQKLAQCDQRIVQLAEEIQQKCQERRESMA